MRREEGWEREIGPTPDCSVTNRCLGISMRRKRLWVKTGGGTERGERSRQQLLVPALPLFSPPPHTCILRGTSVPCSFSSTRPPNCRNRRGLPQFYYNRSQKCVVSASAFSLQNKSAEHSGVGTRTHEQRRADAPVQTAPVVSAALFTGVWIGRCFSYSELPKCPQCVSVCES